MSSDASHTTTHNRPLSHGQRRHATVFFSDISHSSEHAERLDAEEYAAVLDQFKVIARRVIEQHGGSIARIQGDGVLAVFGQRVSQETDGRDAVQAALALHEQVAVLNVGTKDAFCAMQMHTGIHAGLVLLLQGDMERGHIDVIGEVPNSAARLCSMAQAGEIWISATSLGRETRFFRHSVLLGQTLKGRSARIDVLKIEGYDTTQTLKPKAISAQSLQNTTLVGREDPLIQLLTLLQKREHGRTALAHISGEPGLGKTRLLQGLTDEINQTAYTVLHAHCDNHLGAEPHQVLRRWLFQLLGSENSERAGLTLDSLRRQAENTLRSLIGEQTAEFMSVLDELYTQDKLGLEDSVKAHETVVPNPQRDIKAFVQQSEALLALLAKTRDLVLIIDDWQWVDDASRRVVDQVWSLQVPAMLVLASRPLVQAEPWLQQGLVLNLAPLNEAQSLAAIALWLPSPSPFVAQDIYQLSGGNPLLLQELCHATSTGQPYMKDGSNQIAWINALVASRADLLPTTEGAVLRACAVLGQDLDVGLLTQITQLDGNVVQTALHSLVSQGFVTHIHMQTYALKHLLTRDAVYATIHLQERKNLHLRAAQGIEAQIQRGLVQQMDEQLALHYDAADVYALAAHHAERAGNKALALMSLDRARAFFLVTLRALDHLVHIYPELKLRWCRISEQLGQACVFDPLDVSHGLALFEQAVQFATEVGNVNAQARAHYWLAYVNYGKGQPSKAVQHCEYALQAATASADQRLQHQLQATLGQSLASAGRYAEAMPLMEQAIAGKYQQSRPGSSVAIGSAYTLGRLGYTLGDIGRFDDAHEAFAQSLHLLGQARHSVKASVLELMCVVYHWQGRWQESQQAGQAGEDMALQCRSHYLVAMGRALSARAQWAHDQSPSALQKLELATQWIESNGGAVSSSLNFGCLVEAHLHQGNLLKARQYAAHLQRRARAQDRQGLGQGCRALALWFASQGQHVRSEHYWQQADAGAHQRGSPREMALNQLSRAQAALQFPQNRAAVTQAKTWAMQAADAFADMHMHWYRGQVELVLAQF